MAFLISARLHLYVYDLSLAPEANDHSPESEICNRISYLYPYIITCLKKLFLLFTIITAGTAAWGQNAFSLATDISLLRNRNKDQEFTALGQSIRTYLHLKPRESVYASISYYTKGKFSNTLTALAYDTATAPQRLNYTVKSSIRYTNLSFGWVHYFVGAYNNEPYESASNWNLYGSAGFGLLLGSAENSHSPQVDTALYEKPPFSREGSGDFKRLTLDLALGVETQIGAGFFLYGEARTWLRASSYPSPYLFNKKAPNVAILSGGLRLLID